jgi:arylsulfatase A-like enzyme
VFVQAIFPSRPLRLSVSCIGLIAIVFGVAVAGAKAADQAPNIVVFLVDDLGARDLACYGSPFYETPQVDRLAAGGMRFTQAYASCPVCSPTRSSMLTGRYPQRTGITDYINTGGGNQPQNWKRNTKLLPAPYADRLALSEQTIAKVLREAGYATFFAGKWHLGGKGFLPTDQGFDINKGGLDWGMPKTYFSPYQNPMLKDGPPGESLTLRLGDETCKFIDAHLKAHPDRPFLAYVPFYSVHVPLEAPEKLVKKYEAKAASLPQSEAEFGTEHASKVRLVQNNATYAAMIEETDNAVGMVLDKLDELSLADNTIVLFTADNGGLSTAEGWATSNAPLRAGKGWMYEGGIRVASIIRWPRVVAASSTCTAPIISCDYFPTFVDAARLPASPKDSQPKIDGVSLLPLLRDEPAGGFAQRQLFWDYPHYGNQGGSPASAVREGRWKLIEWREDDSVELFDLEADPSEERNLAEREPERVKRMQAMIKAWRQAVGAKSPTANPAFDPSRPWQPPLPPAARSTR